jgi:hypothetical protein
MSPQTREGAGLKAGAVLVREQKGRLERVTVLEEGFTSGPSSAFGPYSAYEPRKAAYPAIHYSCAPCRKDWLFVRLRALVSSSDAVRMTRA